MKRKAKSSGSGGRLRLGLLLAAVSAFLLVPAASAFANVTAEISFAGEGAGWVEGEAGAEGGEPEVKCHWNGTEIDVGMEGSEVKAGVCKTAALPLLGEGGIFVFQEADSGSEFGGWTVMEGVDVSGCSPAGCGVAQFAPSPAGIKIKATFNLKSEPLNLTVSGAAGGELECSISGAPKSSCPTEAPVGKNVKVYPTGTGVELDEWTTGPCESTNDNPCEFTMPEAEVSANAAFQVASEELTVNNLGSEGTVECNIEGGGAAPCAPTYTLLYGETVEVTAEAAFEHKLASLTGPGCSLASETEGSCSFTIGADSTVTAEFEPAGTKDEAEVNTVNGEVPIKTALESSCPSVYLGEFAAGVTHNYHNTCTVKLTSTGVETELTAADETGEAPTGHLVQDYVDKNSNAHHYFLPSALEVAATDSEGKATGGVGSTLTGLDPNPVTLLAFSEPIAKDQTTLEFNQPIGNHDGLHTGPYSKTITLTLEQTTP